MQETRNEQRDADMLIDGDCYLVFVDRRSGRYSSHEFVLTVRRDGYYSVKPMRRPGMRRFGQNDGIVQLMIEDFLRPQLLRDVG